MLINTQKEQLPDVARCHMQCFPNSLATRLGSSYVAKTLDWFLSSPNRFLFHIIEDSKVVGYCGGFVPTRRGDGSSSGMLQHAFNEAMKGILKRPWLIFHPEVRVHYPFIYRNIKRKITGRVVPAGGSGNVTASFTPYAGLVVIGVLPAFRGKGIAQELMSMFENKSRGLQQQRLILSVKKTNERAIKAYKNYGWNIKEEEAQTFVLEKLIN